jgi:GDP-4-dehydro-6-deoxy-D-mannose reductase
MDINGNGTINLFESILQVQKLDATYNPTIVVACSSAEYGASLTPENTPVNEKAELLPLHPYGVSKVTQDLLTYQYYKNYGLNGIRARIFNTTGTRKIKDAVSEFTRRAVQIEKGIITTFKHGNLTAQRAIADVRDLVSALVLLAAKGTPGDVYNISGSNVYPISDVIATIEQVMGIILTKEEDPALLRPTDEPVIFGDSTKLIAATNWQQTIPLQTTITDMINYWRTKL